MMTKLEAKEGLKFALKDRSAVYDNIIYLSDIDDPARYVEVTEEEAEAIKAELEKTDKK